jgi:2-dehydropantoate 2-reductase
MRYVIIGAGAVGGTIAARLHLAGSRVAVVARGEHGAVIARDGLAYADPTGAWVVRLTVHPQAAQVDWSPGDVAVLATKSQDSAAIIDDLAANAPSVPVLCAQNGVANERVAAARFADVYGICVMLPAEHLRAGAVTAYSGPVPGILDLGRCPEGTDELAVAVVADLRAAGFSSQPESAIMRWKFRKLIMNLANAGQAICGPDDPDLPALAARAAAEGEATLTAAGIAVATRAEDAVRRAELITPRLVAGVERGGGSTWQSLTRGTAVETPFLNGEIVALGRAHGVPTPVNQLLLDVVADLAERGERPGAVSAAELLTRLDAAPPAEA